MQRYATIVTCLIAATFPSSLRAYEPMATTSDGRLIRCSVKTRAPWASDVVKSGLPDYPYSARTRRQEGDGWFQMRIRPDGTVESVKTLKSAGYSTLDEAAIACLMKWRFKPGKWKSIDYPIYFSMHRPR